MATQIDQVLKEQSVADTGTLNAQVDTGSADAVFVFVDNGTSGGAPASYDYLVEYETYDGSGSYQQWSSVSGTTSVQSEKYDPPSGSVSVTLTNQSGAPANYRLNVVAVKFD